MNDTKCQEGGTASGEDRSKDTRGPDHILDLTELCICVLCVCVCVRSPVFVCVKYEVPHRLPVPHLKTSFLYPSLSLILFPISLIP